MKLLIESLMMRPWMNTMYGQTLRADGRIRQTNTNYRQNLVTDAQIKLTNVRTETRNGLMNKTDECDVWTEITDGLRAEKRTTTTSQTGMASKGT